MTEASTGYIIEQQPPDAPLTARNLEDFAQCPRKYLLSFFSGHARTSAFIGGPAALHRAVRAALLDLYAAGGAAVYALEDLLQAFEAAWDGALCKDSREEEDLHRQALLMLTEHWRSPLDIGSDVQADLRLEERIGAHSFVAVADLATSRPPRALRFTTSRRPPSPGELPQSLSWGVLYLLGLRRLADRDATGEDFACVMVDLRGGREAPFSLDDDQRTNLEGRLTDVADRIRREREFPPITGKQCRWCRSRSDCPARR